MFRLLLAALAGALFAFCLVLKTYISFNTASRLQSWCFSILPIEAWH